MYIVLVAQTCIHEEAAIYKVLQTHFSGEFIIQSVRNSREFFHFIQSANADIILLDMKMPGINIYDIKAYLQNVNQNCVILPMTELNSFDCSLVPDDPFVLDYLLKPFTDRELILTFEDALYLCKKRRRLNRSLSTFTVSDDLSRMDIVRRRIQQYIADHYSEIISMQDVAQAMNYSDTHFCRLFKQCFQVNFSLYLNDFRVDRAQELLTGTNLTVKEIAMNCGYRDTSYFIRVFKRHTGMTPSDYRIHKLTMTAKKSNNS